MYHAESVPGLIKFVQYTITVIIFVTIDPFVVMKLVNCDPPGGRGIDSTPGECYPTSGRPFRV